MKKLDIEQEHQRRKEEGEALPEPRKVKREILWAKNQAEEQILETAASRTQNIQTVENLLKSVGKLFLKVRAYAERYDENKEHERLQKLKQVLRTGSISNADKGDVKELVDTFYEIDEIIYELGITDIGVKTERSQPFGYDFLSGLSMDLNTRFAEWKRLKENMRNITQLLEQDGDFFVVVTSETSGLGKSTLMAALLEEMNAYQDLDCGEKNLVFTDNDFWNAFDLPPRSTFGIDEGPRLFYNKDAIKKNQKKRKTKIKTGRYNNIGIIACFHDFYDLDKELINTNVNCNIHVPRKGYFEFYNKKQIESFEKDDNGKCKRKTKPAFEGSFPDYSGRMWKIYKDNEEKKDRGIKESAHQSDSDEEKSAHCNNCGYDWTPRKDNIQDIKACPNCNSRKWNEEADE